MVEKKENITLKIKSDLIKWQILAVILAILLIVSVATFGFKSMTGSLVLATEKQVEKSEGQKVDVSKVTLEGAHILGNENALVTIFEWVDFECSYCRFHALETHPLIVENYVNTGKVKIVFKHYPLSFHEMARPAALASECAAEQGQFWGYHDLIFDKESNLSLENLGFWANQLGLDIIQFNNCLESERYLEKIDSNMQEGKSIKITGTPAFVINGYYIGGAAPYYFFEETIEEALK